MGAPVLRWSMFGGCGEITCEGRPARDGFELSISNEGTPLALECVEDQALLLRRSAEIRARLKEMGFVAHAPKQVLTDMYGDPDRPSTTLAACVR